VIALSLALFAPLAAAQDADAGTETAGTMAVDALSAETVIATVGDYQLTLGELIAVRQALPQQYQSLPPEVLTEGLVTQLINQTVLSVRARQTGLDQRRDIALDLRNQRNSALADAFLRSEVESRIDSDALREAYEARYAEAEPVREVRAAHILVETEEKAQELKAALDDGAAFADLAAEHNPDATAEKGGDLGWFGRGDMVPAFADAAFAMEPGTLSAPVETPFGWHLIRLEAERTRPVPAFEEVREDLLKSLAEEAQKAILAEAREAAPITRPDKALPPEAVLQDALIEPEGAQ